jgi:methionine-rich copper-binding protein CopC
MLRNSISMSTLALIACTLMAASATAHPSLISASPAANLSSTAPPKEIKLNFSEGVIAKFSGLVVKDESGKTIATGVAVTNPKDKKQLIVPLPTPLAAGRYTVNWQVVSEDTHRVQGQYSFTVEP